MRKILVVAFLMSPFVASAQTLVNPGFETNGTGWGKFGNVSFEEWAKETEGFGAAFQAWATNGGGGFFQSEKGMSGGKYAFSVRGKKEEYFQATNVFLRLEFYTADDTTKAGPDGGVTNIVNLLTTSWQTFSTSAKAPEGTTLVRPVFGFEGATNGNLGGKPQSAMFDNATLTGGP